MLCFLHTTFMSCDALSRSLAVGRIGPFKSWFFQCHDIKDKTKTNYSHGGKFSLQ